MNVLLTGATGNVGLSVLKALKKEATGLKIVVGLRNIPTDAEKMKPFNVSMVTFDFENINTYQTALQHIDILFLLRPPQLADVPKYFKPLIHEAVNANIKHIVFLSVQGVENSKFIPHHKIEQLIIDSKIPYTFLRPAYFMQNFTTTLKHDIVSKHQLFLPAGKAKFTIIDVDDIGAVTAKVLINPQLHIRKSYELTNKQVLTFYEMAETLSNQLNKKITFISPNLLQFYLIKRKENLPPMLILVMIMLHYLPRFQKQPETTEWVKIITNNDPKTFKQFIDENKNSFL
jgi:uncharacterized protein YbjT (DUF2867 family)